MKTGENMNITIVTRHQGLVDFLEERGIVGAVIHHASADMVRNRDVIGVLPLSLAVHALSVTEAVLELPKELRGVELTKEQVAKHFVGFRTFRVLHASPPQVVLSSVLEKL
jgi:hypothetical protein